METQNQPSDQDNGTTPTVPASNGEEAQTLLELHTTVLQRRREQGIPENGGTVAEPRMIGAIARPQWTSAQLEQFKKNEAEYEARAQQHKEYLAGLPEQMRREALSKFIAQRGKRYEGDRLENFKVTCPKQQAVLDKVQEFAASINDRIAAGQNVLFIGPTGTGKDLLMNALIHAAIKAWEPSIPWDGRKRVEWRNQLDLFRELRATMDKRGVNEEDVTKPLERCDVLCMSDPIPPKGGLTEYQSAVLASVIDSRYSNLKPVWLTMNVASRKEAGERIGEAIIDRLGHDAMICKCDWPSFRQQEGRE